METNSQKHKSKLLKILAFLLIIIISFLVFFISSTLLTEYQEYKEVEDTQQEIIDEVVTTDGMNEAPFSIDWKKLQAINKDIVAWIRIPNTNISYPVVKGTSDSQYLRKNIYGGYSRGGTPFVEANTENPFDCGNTIIYGHNLMNGTIFSQLKRYSSNDFSQSHKTVYIYLPDNQVREYEVISFHNATATDKNLYNPYVTDLNEYKEYMFSNNQINTDYSVFTTTGKVITLSTCTNGNENSRYVLHAILKQ